eukprot:TRINITY_DN4189_c0_g6_i1.p1 TRINITY_DN4189_c0_g6~~TRINITY_DN4189_c0_g6_i1.p1  ORF type:complete len:156 (+),score=18.03 TRINITY_DN4189_c0_g6_i1:83-550(+)
MYDFRAVVKQAFHNIYFILFKILRRKVECGVIVVIESVHFTLKLPSIDAKGNAVSCCKFVALMSTPVSTKNFTHFKSPFSALCKRGASPSLFVTVTSALCSTRYRAISRFPFLHATKKGLDPALFCALTSAPFSTNAFTEAILSRSQARDSGVFP